MSKVLLLGGTGAMGVYLTEYLKKSGYEVFVTSRSVHNDEENVHYLLGDVKKTEFLNELLKEKYDCIIDFMVYSTVEFFDRYRKLLDSTEHYIYLSSYRVFADNGTTPIKEDSPKLLDVSDDWQYLKTDEYALTKARQERMLKESGAKNYTIIRPSITFSKQRFQLGTLEAGVLIPRAFKKRPVILPNEMLEKCAAVSWAGDVARMIEKLVLNPQAYGEDFNVCSDEKHTWAEIAKFYEDNIGLKVVLVALKTYIKAVGGIYQIMYDRMVNRIMDNSKILRVTGIDKQSLMSIEDAIKMELSDIDTKFEQIKINKKINKKIDRVLRKMFWKNLWCKVRMKNG